MQCNSFVRNINDVSVVGVVSDNTDQWNLIASSMGDYNI